MCYVAKKAQSDVKVIRRIFDKNNWKRRTCSERRKFTKFPDILTYDVLYKDYITDKLSSTIIAKKYNTNTPTVLKYLRKHKILVRTLSESQKEINNGRDNSNWKHGKYVRKFLICNECGKPVSSGCKTGYCRTCFDKTRKFLFLKCIDCGQELNTSNRNRKRCRKCYVINIKTNPTLCLLCNKSLTKKEGQICGECQKIPENNPNWKGGLSRLPYPLHFNEKLKLKIRTRDNFACQNYGILEKDYKRKLDIHHISYNKMNCKKNNLITLCSSCNVKANYNRDYWFAFYRYILDNSLINS